MLRPIDRENFDSQLQSFSIREIVQNMSYLACKANEIIEAVNELLEREKEKKQSAENEQRSELSPCPFCGGNAVLKFYDDVRSYIVTCGEDWCGVSPSTHLFGHKKDAIEAWNKRSVND